MNDRSPRPGERLASESLETAQPNGEVPDLAMVGIPQAYKRPSRAKRCLAWERHELETNGFYTPRAKKIAAHHPLLTPTQLRIAALITGLLSNYEISTALKTSVHAVEKIRSCLRIKLQLPKGASLTAYLVSLI